MCEYTGDEYNIKSCQKWKYKYPTKIPSLIIDYILGATEGVHESVKIMHPGFVHLSYIIDVFILRNKG